MLIETLERLMEGPILTESIAPSRQFKSRKGFMDFLASLMELSFEEKKQMAEYGREIRGKQAELKTYIMESNNATTEISGHMFATQYSTDLPEISILRLEYENRVGTFYVDSTDKRFLVLYTNDLVEIADPLYNRLVHSTSNYFDKIWLPTEVLDDLSKLSGNVFKGFGLKYSDFFASVERDQTLDELRVAATGPLSSEALNALNTSKKLGNKLSYSKMRVLRGNDESFATDELRFNGRIITTSGDSAEDHVSFVDIIRKFYRRLIEHVEGSSIGVRKVEDRMLLEGHAFDLELNREIDDLDRFTRILLNSRKPFRLWGLKNKVFPNMQKVAAVDLHTGDPIDLEITPSLIRVYLPKKACGNTVLRLYVNLQHHFDSSIRFNGEKRLS
jgi:hypothetical protein